MVCGDGEMLPLRDSSFDVVIMINVVDSERGDSLMREAARVGSLVVAVSPRESDNLFLMSRGGAIIPPE